MLGKGVMKSVPLNALGAEDATVTLPPWEPGIVCAGRVLDAAGTPYQGDLEVVTRDRLYCRVRTDGNGRFTVAGVLPGSLPIRIPLSSHAWAVQISEAGAMDLDLRMGVPAAAFHEVGQVSPHAGMTWWLPRIGHPITVTPDNATTGLTHGGGWIWSITDARHGEAVAVPMTVVPPTASASSGDYTNIVDVAKTPQGPRLGIILPFSEKRSRPGSIRIEGLDSRVGVGVSFAEPRWESYPELGIIGANIGGVPPGNYRVSVMTEDGLAVGETVVTEAGGHICLGEWR
jgi:hypothetical protein